MPPIDSHRINLMPVAVRERQEGRNLLYLLIAGGIVFVLLLGFLWYQKGQQITKTRDDIAAQKRTNQQLQSEIRKLEYIVQKAQDVQRREAQVKDAWGGEVSWYRVLQDIATTMPTQTWLTSYQSSRSTPAQRGPVVVTGSFSVSGRGFDHPDSADWLARISQMREVAGLWLSSSSVSGEGAAKTATFASSGSLTSEAWSPRARRAASGNIYEGTNAQ